MNFNGFNVLLIVFLTITMTACQTMVNSNKTFDYTGAYATAHKTKEHYHQTLTINRNNNSYHVEFSATQVRGRAGCSFLGTAVKKDGILWLNVSNEPDKKVAMYIRPTQDRLGVEVFTKNFDQRFAMMYYCRGGASLAGNYFKN